MPASLPTPRVLSTYDVTVSETLTDHLLGRLIDGRYEVRERIAAGGMATVYLAFDKRLERMVAVKVMHSSLGTEAEKHEFASRFRREAKAAARLTHPGMVRVYDQGTDGDISYLTMEYVEGENLRSRLAHEATLTVGESLAIVDAVLDALAAAHRQGLVHRDVKPENVLLDDEDRPKLADFGLARAVTEVTATSTGTILGTVAYLAPELVQNGQADASTDVYSTGVLLFEMLTGRQPFTAASAIEVAARHVHEDVPAPSAFVPWLPAEIDELVAALTARDPLARPADAAAALGLVRQTRSMIDDPTLDRRADPPTGTIPVADDAATAVLDTTPTGATIALPIGLGAGPFAPVTAELIDDDPEAIEPGERRHVALWIGSIVAALLALLALGGWWYNTQGPGAYTTVPPVVGDTADEATAILQQAELEVNVISEFSYDIPEGLVIRTEPGAQQQMLKGDAVDLIVSKGPQMATVPTLVGSNEQDAINALSDVGLTVGQKERRNDDDAPQGQVLAVEPGEGETIRDDTPINLVISDGPAPVAMPDVTGFEEPTARAALEQYKFVITVQYERTNEVATGEVIRTDPAAGTETNRTASITLYVSEGKPLVTVPSFLLMTIGDAQDRADQLGLDLRFERRFPFDGNASDDKTITDQDVDPNTQVEQGSRITLTYSSLG